MSIDYSASLAIGYQVTQEMLNRFKVNIDPVWHMEQRFNSKTGARLPDEKVIDSEGGTVYRFQGEEYDYPEDLVNDICTMIGNATYWTEGEYYDGDPDDVSWIIGPKFEDVESGASYGGLDCYGALWFPDIQALDVDRVGQALLKLGIRLTENRAIVKVVGSEH